jgi:putative aminopeptidase FrvX
MISLINRLVQIPGPSGYETYIRQAIQKEIEGLPVQMRTDNLGNLIVNQDFNNKKGKRIMLVAHMDEIGIMATHIDQEGFVRFTTLGGVRPVNCVGGRVKFLNGVQGVVGSYQMTNPGDAPSIDQLFIDVGVSSREKCPLQIGDVAVFERPFLELGERLVSKAMDDRIGVTILIETLRDLKKSDHQIFFVFSTQEEVGVRGATAAAFGVEPDLGLAVDVTGTGDTPKGLKMNVRLGQGPAIKIRDSGMLADPRIIDWMEKAAQNISIPHQREILDRGGTDARAIQISRSGVPAGCLSIPCRYVHSPSEMVDINDVHDAVKLLIELLSNPITLN